MVKLYVIWNDDEIKKMTNETLNSDDILLCINPFNEDNNITNTSKTSNNYTILYFNEILILKMIRLKIEHIIIGNSIDNYNTFTENMRKLSNYNSIKFDYVVGDINYDKPKMIRIMKSSNNIIFESEEIFNRLIAELGVTNNSKKYIVETDSKILNYNNMKLTKRKKSLKFEKLNEVKINMYKNDIDNEKLREIYGNIDTMLRLVKKYKNILFICGDYPGYGGAQQIVVNYKSFLV